ncbi:MAG: sigma-70 family RNA polymerase sigma factor [Myxococcota bacterium]
MTLRLATSAAAASDGELLGRIGAGDSSALGHLYDRHAGQALGVALRVLGSREDAEDVVQDVFWRLWTGRARYDPARGRFRGWFNAMARNRAIDVLRSGARRTSMRAEDPAALTIEEDGPEENAEAELHRRRVEAALATLPPELKELVELAFYRGLTHREIAQHIGQPLGTVKSRIHRSLGMLREALAPLGDTP